MFSQFMKIRDLRLLVFRFAALMAVVVSGLALAKLLSGQCNVCNGAQFASVLGAWGMLLLPWLGLGGALALLLLSFCRGVWPARLRVSLALVGGGVALGLFLIQAGLLRSFCPTCCLVDSAFVLAAVIDAGSGAREPEPAR